MIVIESLRKSYRDIKAVDGVSFQIEQGEIFGLLGPNGAGKTTTVNMLAGLIAPDAGQILIRGEPYHCQYPIRKEIGIVPQSLSFYERLTAQENLAFWGRLYGLRGKSLKEQVAWALDFVGLSDRANQIVADYSGGMERRLNLACALLHRPSILFMDEPTVGVDPQSRNFIFGHIEKLQAQGCTILYTTHYMEEAQRLCHRVAIMAQGKILALAPVADLIKQYGGKSVIEMELKQLPADITKLPGQLHDKTLSIETDNPLAVLPNLLQAKLDYLDLKIKQPNLETVFLNLTGRRLQD